jgi:hypothetical protein
VPTGNPPASTSTTHHDGASNGTPTTKSFLPISAGLTPAHRHEAPLFEKTYVPPRQGARLVSRVYADGSLYYLSQAREPGGADDADKTWNAISRLTDKGLSDLREALEACCKIESNPRLDAGTVVWKVSCAGRIHEVVVSGVPEGNEKRFDRVDAILNTSLRPIPPG